MRPSLHRGVERERNRGRRGVGMLVDRDHDFFRRKAELPRGRVEDARIGLVRHDPVDVGRGQAGGVEHFVEHRRRG